MPILAAARLIKPLGNPAANGIKFFAASDVLELSKDRAWLAKVTNALNQHWQKKNAANKNWLTGESPKEHSASTSVAMTGD